MAIRRSVGEILLPKLHARFSRLRSFRLASEERVLNTTLHLQLLPIHNPGHPHPHSTTFLVPEKFVAIRRLVGEIPRAGAAVAGKLNKSQRWCCLGCCSVLLPTITLPLSMFGGQLNSVSRERQDRTDSADSPPN